MQKRLLLLAICFYGLAGLAAAEQTSFNKRERGDNYEFSYQWRDHNQQPQAMQFSLSKQALFSPFRRFRAYNTDIAAQHVQRQIRQYLKQNPIAGVNVTFGNALSDIRLSGRNPQDVNHASEVIKAQELTFFNEYLRSQYYHQFTDHSGTAGIKPDHVRIARDSVQTLAPTKPIILDIVNVKNIRLVTNYVLGFVQNIPYSPLASRLTSSGAGFNVPTKVLWENQGDCDSKMTLTIAILRALMPRINMVMVYIDQHAFIGLEMLPEAGDVTLNYRGRTFVLGDPTGPRLMPLGQLSFEAEQAVRAKHYTVELFE
ncbi:hypothetical protein [Thalassotalea euphylliae]|uniref:hypothetical protein n=1 Tax=Thalassotalea euphylliae TaxID=1655234 RepID=UPI00216116B0|nr:hypothetical protein [Thalassotalea euphylliae]